MYQSGCCRKYTKNKLTELVACVILPFLLILTAAEAAAGILVFKTDFNPKEGVYVCEMNSGECHAPDEISKSVGPSRGFAVFSNFVSGKRYYLYDEASQKVVSDVVLYPKVTSSMVSPSMEKALFVLLGSSLSLISPVIAGVIGGWYGRLRAKRRMMLIIDSWRNDDVDETVDALHAAGFSDFQCRMAKNSLEAISRRIAAGNLTIPNAKNELLKALAGLLK